MKNDALPTLSELSEYLRYDAVDGQFYWIKAQPFRPYSVGKVAGGDFNGYRGIRFRGQMFYSHRLAWLFCHKEWPSGQIDHKDGDRRNNRMNNLRISTQTQNMGNQRISKRNTSGLKGVSWNRRLKKWAAHIRCGGPETNTYLGLFDTREAAHAAYMEAAHRLFGEFARAA